MNDALCSVSQIAIDYIFVRFLSFYHSKQDVERMEEKQVLTKLLEQGLFRHIEDHCFHNKIFQFFYFKIFFLDS